MGPESYEQGLGELNVEPGELDSTRSHFLALLDLVALKSKDEILWAQMPPNAKGLTEVSPLHIKVVAGA